MSKLLNFPGVAIVSIPVSLAMLCAKCHNVSNSPNITCGVCGSKDAVLPLASILNREPEPPEPPAMSNSRPAALAHTSAEGNKLHVVNAKALEFSPRLLTA
jgi:hypothetical protein